MGSLLADAVAVMDRAGDPPDVAAVREAHLRDGLRFASSPEAFRFMAAVGDDDSDRRQGLWTALRVLNAFGSCAVTGTAPWDVHASWMHDVPSGIVPDPPEDDFGHSLETLTPEQEGGRPMRLARVRHLLTRESASPFIRIVINNALTVYTSLRPFQVARAGLDFRVSSVKMAGLFWAAH